MIQTIENGVLKVAIKSRGAELTSIQSMADNTEFLWQAAPVHWNRQAPILFPIVGQLKDDKFRLGNRNFQMPRHGFARDSEFQFTGGTGHSARFDLQHDEATMKNYPFPFQLGVSYCLYGNRLAVKYTVENPSARPLYFSIGGHPALRCPIEDHEEFDDYYLEFEKSETQGRWLLNDGLYTGTQETCLDQQQILRLSRDLFQKGAVVFRGLESQRIALKSQKSNRAVTMDFEGFPYFAIWTLPANAPFLCLEPWYGLADFQAFDGDFIAKEGIQALREGQAFSCEYGMTFA